MSQFEHRKPSGQEYGGKAGGLGHAQGVGEAKHIGLMDDHLGGIPAEKGDGQHGITHFTSCDSRTDGRDDARDLESWRDGPTYEVFG